MARPELETDETAAGDLPAPDNVADRLRWSVGEVEPGGALVR